MACSPDGLVGENDIIEIKCPYNIKDMTPEEGVIANKIKYLKYDQEGNIKLKKNDNYYYQVQGQLKVANKHSCYFIVWTPKGIYELFFYCKGLTLQKVKKINISHNIYTPL